MIKIYFFLSSFLLTTTVFAEEPAFAEPHSTSCPYVLRNNYDAIDRALPCTNFRLHSREFQGERFLREAMRQGVYNELVQRNQLESGCKEAAYAQKLADETELNNTYEEIAARFVHYRPAFRRIRENRVADAQATAASGPSADCYNEGCMSIRGGMNAQLQSRDQVRDGQRDQLITRIPYGFEPHVADAIRQLDNQLPDNFPEGATQAQINLFRSKLRDAFFHTQRAYAASRAHFAGLVRATDCVQTMPDGRLNHITTPEEIAPRTCPAGQEPAGVGYAQEDGTWRALSQSGAIANLAREIRDPADAANQYILQNTLACNADPYASRQATLSSFAIATGVLALVPGVGLLVVTGISAYVYSQQVAHSCFGGQATGFRVVDGLSCTRGMGLEGAVHAADTTDCGRDIMTLGGAVAFTGAVGTARRLLSGAEDVLGVATTTAARNADNVLASAAGGNADAAAAALRAADDGPPIVVTGRAPRRRAGGSGNGRRNSEAPDSGTPRRSARDAERPSGGARAADDAADAAGDARVATAADDSRAAASVRDSSPPRSVPDQTPNRTLVRDNIDNENVRLSPEQIQSLQDETFARKEIIDRIIAPTGRDVNAQHNLLNDAIDAGDLEGYIRTRGLRAEDAAQLRTQVAILREERLVLTRARVNEDLDSLNGIADVRTVPCAPVNGLNGGAAFLAESRCSVVTFTRAVENYCSCGQRGALGSWAGPCANALANYLSGDQLVDRDALPERSAAGLRECKRIRIPAGTSVVHGGLRPTFSGHGGAAQIFLPTRAFGDRGDGVNRLLRAVPERQALGLTDDVIRNADEIEVVAIAPISPHQEVTSIFDAGRVCRQSPGGCTAAQTEQFARDFERFSSRNRGALTQEQREQFQEWHDWIRGCRPISVGFEATGSSFSGFDPARPGCRHRRTF